MSEKISVADEKATEILENLFLNRKVVILDTLAVNIDGGGLHCITMHHPMLVLN
ncbi:agmatine deiminase family protein [Marivirga sp.]|uniref:agmatine deiminase family protein n=1 Tax=Marivirga sp. TaxID=2018662 RepID=UPI003DA709C1